MSSAVSHPTRRSVLAISSGGGHWIELLRLRPAFAGHFVTWATVSDAYRAHLHEGEPLSLVPDVTRWDRFGLVTAAARISALIARLRPDVVLSTGALPGFFGVVLAKRMGARTVWLDSLANVEELSMSGQKIGSQADLWLTQWPELAHAGGPEHAGSVLRLAEGLGAPPKELRKVFVTVGAQMPFDRLVAAIDVWAGQHPEVAVRAQIGPSDYVAKHMHATPFLSPAEFEAAFAESDAIVGHAGVGTLFAALERGTPIVVLPRESKRRETRNDHQIATAKRFDELCDVSVAWSESELGARLDGLSTAGPTRRLSPDASEELLGTIARFIDA